MKMSSPANILPNNRMPSDSADLAAYSMMFSSRLKGNSSTAPDAMRMEGRADQVFFTKPAGCLIFSP